MMKKYESSRGEAVKGGNLNKLKLKIHVDSSDLWKRSKEGSSQRDGLLIHLTNFKLFLKLVKFDFIIKFNL